MTVKQCVRCRWVNLKNERYIRYHDEEWGRLICDDRKLYELLILESFQAGLSWECILNKRDAFREAFDGFDVMRVAAYTDEKVEELMQNKGIVRNRRKILAAIKNSRIFQQIVAEFGSFSDYLRRFTGGGIVREPFTLRTTSPLSDEISRDLSRRGMTFVGSTIVYSYLQAIGVIFAHTADCFLADMAK